MNKHHYSTTATITGRIMTDWQIDNGKRQTSHLCRLIVENSTVQGVQPGHVVELRIRIPLDFDELPTLPGRVVLEVKPVSPQSSKSMATNWYYTLVPDFGMLGRPQPAVLLNNIGAILALATREPIKMTGQFTKAIATYKGETLREFRIEQSCGIDVGRAIEIFTSESNIAGQLDKSPCHSTVALSGIFASPTVTDRFEATKKFLVEIPHKGGANTAATTPPTNKYPEQLIRRQSVESKLTARTPKGKPVRGKFK